MAKVAQEVRDIVKAQPVGQIFGYRDFPAYVQTPAAVVKAVNRLVQEKRLERLSKGKFYVAKVGLVGLRKPDENELLRDALYKNGRLRGYVTGLAAFNQLGLTPQVPRTVTLAVRGGQQKKQIGPLSIRTQPTSVPIEASNVYLLQILDALKGIQSIPDADINLSLSILRKKIAELPQQDQARLLSTAELYYAPRVRALAGMLFESLGLLVPDSLKTSLNPTTIYRLALDAKTWPKAKQWNIR